MFGVGKVDVGDHIHDAAVGFLGQALVAAAVAGLHMEDGDVQALGRDGGQTGVRVPQHQQRVRAHGSHELIGRVDDVAHGLAQVGADGVKVDVGISERKVAEEDAVQRVVVVLSRVRQQAVEVTTACLDHLGQADDFRARPHDDEQLEAPVIGEMDV